MKQAVLVIRLIVAQRHMYITHAALILQHPSAETCIRVKSHADFADAVNPRVINLLKDLLKLPGFLTALNLCDKAVLNI